MKLSLNQLAEKICTDLIYGTRTRHERSFIVTNFSYPDGDSINAYLEREKQNVFLSDKGVTRFKALDRRIDFADASHLSRIGAICALHNVIWNGVEIKRKVSLRTAPADMLAFCQATLRLADLAWHHGRQQKRTFPESIESFVVDRIEPHRKVERGWTLSAVDTKQVYPVDYHFNTTTPAVNMLTIGSSSKATFASAVANFLRAHNDKSSIIAVVDVEANLGDKHVRRLQLACDELVFGIAGNEDRITKLALGSTN